MSLKTSRDALTRLAGLLGSANRLKLGENAELEAFLEAEELFAPLIQLLTELEFSEEEARAHWSAIVAHREDLGHKLGRDGGLPLATLDYFYNLKSVLENPKLVEMGIFEQKKKSAITDSLTGLYNRAYFDSSLRREAKRSTRYRVGFSLVMLDLDNFKTVNDQLGHVNGDHALQKCSKIIQDSVREIDIPCRYGGEEFALILPETSRAGAYIVSERIRIDVQAHFDETYAEHGFSLSVSGGVALFPHDSAEIEGLVEMADKALYGSKHSGKNRITLYANEKRRSPRLEAAQRVFLHDPKRRGGPVEAKNVSRDGALMESDRPLSLGEELQITLRSPQNGTHYIVKGRVVRQMERTNGSRRAYDVGVAFIASTTEERRKIDELASDIYNPMRELDQEKVN